MPVLIAVNRKQGETEQLSAAITRDVSAVGNRWPESIVNRASFNSGSRPASSN